jgi:two-component system, cell cycle sensor histidine kinase and response regulator CckA
MPVGILGTAPRERLTPAGAPTVLVVEDESMVRDLVSGILQTHGYAVLKARQSTEALCFSDEFPGTIHLLLTDLCMPPHANGRILAGRIRAARPGTPVVYMSGFVDDDGLVGEVQSGLAHFLPKPFSPEALMALVRVAMARTAEPA